MTEATQSRTGLTTDASGLNDSARVLADQAAWHLDRAGASGIGRDEWNQHLAQARFIGTALAEFPEARASAANLLGRIALEAGDLSLAGTHLNQAVRQAPNDAGIRFSLGHLALQQNELADAAHEFRRAIALDPDATLADQSLALVKLRSGFYAEAFTDYRHLMARYPNSTALKVRLLECARRVQADYDDPGLASAVVTLMREPGLDHQALAALAGSLLMHRYQLQNAQSQIDFQTLASDELLLDTLPHLLFVHPAVDDLLCTLRQALLHHLLARGDFDPATDHLLGGLIAYGTRSEYVLYASPGEQEAITGLKEHLQMLIDQATPDAVALPLALLGLYEPLVDWESTLTRLAPEDQFPAPVYRALSRQVRQVLVESQRAGQIPAITPIENAVSCAVQAQYEENPYPRWEYLPRHTQTGYLQAVAREIPAYRAQEPMRSHELNILVAGTGTGRHAVHLARHFFDTRVLALDLSRRSLAYAEQQAEALELANIRFRQADLLQLGQAELAPFDVIECSGVLHHMQDPMAGWRILVNHLQPDGIMKVGLYSTRARRIVQELRTLIRQQALDASPDAIRLFRHELLQQADHERLKTLVQSEDFYSLSGVRDLLFHVQEHTFTPLEIDACIQQLGLEFLGFVLTPRARQAYRHFFPQDQQMKDLANWDRLERDNPDLFAGMFQFYVRKRY